MDGSTRYFLQIGKKENDTQGVGHFYHFLIGYLLPSIEIILRKGKQHKNMPAEYLLEISVPELKTIAQDVLRLLDCTSYQIVDKKPNAVTKVIKVPRWDQALSYHAAWIERKLWLITKNIIKEVLWYKSTPKLLVYFACKRKIHSFHHLIRTKLNNGPKIADVKSVLFITRTPARKSREHEDMDTWNPQKAKSRVAFINTDITIEKFLNNGIQLTPFEPGTHTIVEQIKQFANCDVIIAMRGAELANVFWMRSGAKVFVMDSRPKSLPSHTKSLANLLNIEYVEFKKGIDHLFELPDSIITVVTSKLNN